MNPLLFIKLLVLILMTNACAHHYYAPNEANLLALEERKDFKISAGTISPADNAIGGGFQLGYSPLKHFGIQASGIYGTSKLDETIEEGCIQGYSGNIALGTYATLKSKKSLNFNRSILLDLYGGLALGKVQNRYFNESVASLNFQREYIQAGLHIQDSIIGFSTTFKFGTLDYTQGLVRGTLPRLYQDQISFFEQSNLYSLGETSLRAYYKISKAKLYFSFTHLIIKENPSSFRHNRDLFINHKFSNFTTIIGIVFDLNELATKRNQTIK